LTRAIPRNCRTRLAGFKRRFARTIVNKFAAFVHIAAGNGGHDAVAGIENRLPVFPADVGRAQKSKP
jgi:hypothetical protein